MMHCDEIRLYAQRKRFEPGFEELELCFCLIVGDGVEIDIFHDLISLMTGFTSHWIDATERLRRFEKEIYRHDIRGLGAFLIENGFFVLAHLLGHDAVEMDDGVKKVPASLKKRVDSMIHRYHKKSCFDLKQRA